MTNTDTSAEAVERVKQEARNEALREAADVIGHCKIMPPKDVILALITEGQSDE